MTLCADKFAVREYIKTVIGAQYLIPLYDSYSHINEIDISKLPKDFVLKPNNSSGKVIICSDKSKMDWNAVRIKLTDWLNDNYFYLNGEWQYKNIIPRIVCEKLLKGDIVDYGFFCFDGHPFICNAVQKDTYQSSNKGYTECFYDLGFKKLDLKQNADTKPVLRPLNWEEMINMARVLSRDFPFVRVDFRECEGSIYFGELTFTPANGMVPFHPKYWDLILGKKIHLDNIPDEYLKK